MDDGSCWPKSYLGVNGIKYTRNLFLSKSNASRLKFTTKSIIKFLFIECFYMNDQIQYNYLLLCIFFEFHIVKFGWK
jgi:hypothetical protein